MKQYDFSKGKHGRVLAETPTERGKVIDRHEFSTSVSP